MTLKREWTDTEYTNAIKEFTKWECKNLIITYGRRDKNADFTYGLPYTSSSGSAMISNTNVTAELKTDRRYKFEYVAITEDGKIVVVCWNDREEEKYITIA